MAIVFLSLAVAACKEEGTIKVHKITFNGVKAVDPSRLKAVLATQESSILPWGKKKYFDRSRFDADLQRIRAFYDDRGYPDARVTGFNVNLNQKQDSVDVTLNIAEGQPVLVTALDYAGFEGIPPAHLDKLKNSVPLKVGQPRDRQLVVTTHEMALNELKDHGFPYAKVVLNEDDGANGKQASIVLAGEPGKLAYFGPVEIRGNHSVSNRIIERELTFKPGELYRRSLVQDSQRRLYGLELFQFANVQPLETDQQPIEVPTRVTVAESRHHRVNFGVGYGTEEKARVDAEYHFLNFLGGARTAGVHTRWSSLDRGVKLDFSQPYLFRPHFSLTGEGQQWYAYTPAYRSVTTGGKATVKHQTNQQNSWSVSLIAEHDSSAIANNVLTDLTLRNNLIALGLDPRSGTQDGTLGAIAFDIQRSTADNILNAKKGYQVSFHAEQAGRFLPGSFNYFAVSADARHYLPIGSRLVYANRLQIGNLAPAGKLETNVPFSRKYFLGGATTIRGWGRYEISPLSGSGLPIGGNSMLAFTSEMRLGFGGNLGLVAFLDGGNVWADSWGIKPGDLRYAIGPGLRYQTPVGPIRFDFGYQLNPEPGLLVNGVPQTRQWRVHFSIGQAF